MCGPPASISEPWGYPRFFPFFLNIKKIIITQKTDFPLNGQRSLETKRKSSYFKAIEEHHLIDRYWFEIGRELADQRLNQVLTRH